MVLLRFIWIKDLIFLLFFRSIQTHNRTSTRRPCH